MPESPAPVRRDTRIGQKIRENLNKQVTLFLQNGTALHGVLLDYFYDPIEKDGLLTLSAQNGENEPSIIFRKDVTTVQPRKRT